MQKGIVSIIVPIYKVEKYIHRCVDSILNQTYPNLEIILVNDGSPDNCGAIVDRYKEKDNRIKVIHKENGGLSDARNHGMKKVTGEFIMFVDSDDWLACDMIETMMNQLEANQADIVQSAFYYAHDDQLFVDKRHHLENDPPVILNNKKLMHELVVNEKVKNFAWGKLYKTELIINIPFEKGVLFEDVFWAHHVMRKVNTYVIIHQPFYYYYQRDDSIVATYTPRNLDMIRGLKERHRFIEVHYEELVDESYRHLFKACLIHYNLLARNRKKDLGGIHRKKIETYIRENYSSLHEAVKHDNELKTQLYLFSLHPYFNMGFLGIKKGLRAMKVLPRPPGLEQVT